MTGNPEYQEIAWTMFQAIIKATETQYANSAIEDVTVEGETKKLDSMEVSGNLQQAKHAARTSTNNPPELLAIRDTEILLPDLLAPGPRQPRRVRFEYGGPSTQKEISLSLQVARFIELRLAAMPMLGCTVASCIAVTGTSCKRR